MRMDEPSLQVQAQAVLEWDRVVELLSQQARSSMGADLCRKLSLESTIEGARERLQETADLMNVQEVGLSFPSISFPDIRDALSHAQKGATLEPHDLRDSSIVLHLASTVAEFLQRCPEPITALKGLAHTLPESVSLESLREEIDASVDHDGMVRETATPELRHYSRHVHDLKQQMRKRLDQILASKRYAEVLQEHYFDLREGRYVVPIKADMRGKIPGIVHDVSSSGATVFLEPRELVDLNNAIKVAELEVMRETRRILHDLSVQVGAVADLMATCMEELAALDVVAAKCAFGRLLNGRVIQLNNQGRIHLRQARHPLLLLAREHIVANDIMLDESVRVLVISGPNTGGKTVTLKIVGLFALMVRAGLPIPCEADSDMALFPEIFADIGDAQDIARDLSSFSAHITQMIKLLRQAPSGEASSSSHSTLVLLDELVTSTDPAEGAALAQALLMKLARLGMKVVVTTHYNSLKVLAQSTDGFCNASVGFDISRLAPTYRLMMGVPGGSSAIDIAGRLGLDESILEEAQQHLHHDDLVLEQVLSDLQEKQRQVEEDRELITQLKEEAARATQEAQEIANALKQTEREDRKGIRQKLTADLLRARAEVQTIIEDLKRERTLIKAKEAKAQLAALEDREQTRLRPVGETVPVDQLQEQDRVEIRGLGVMGIILESPVGKKHVRVRVGEREMLVEPGQLMGSREREAQGSSTKKNAITAIHEAGPKLAEETTEPASIVDLRGQSSDDALDMTVAALDRATLSGIPWLRIIHGHGTGRLKSVLRDYLKTSPYVVSFRKGERAEGGDGVTIANLR